MKKTKDIEYSADHKKWGGRYGTIIAAFAIILTSSIIIRNGLINIQKNRESVSVKGLAERVVRADSAIWVIPISEAGDDLESVRDKIDIDVRRIFAYLKKYDIEDNEIEQDIMRVYDKLAQKFYDEHNKAKRFSIDHQLIIKSSNVEAVHKASKNINELLKEGVTLSYDGYNSSYSPRYLFTKLNEVKPEMLSEAMQEAQKAAEQLLKPSNSRVGGIKYASQGAFSIYSREANSKQCGHCPRAGYGQYSSNEAYFIEKVLRVVASVDYYIEK
ncbi:MAG: SIMPL domain-containing protein [Candidatus Midichloria sp.]|nr:SIMPL domain-containing protein [Candidatus Midichloria sp.]